jgi:hypothetical protein
VDLLFSVLEVLDYISQSCFSHSVVIASGAVIIKLCMQAETALGKNDEGVHNFEKVCNAVDLTNFTVCCHWVNEILLFNSMLCLVQVDY